MKHRTIKPDGTIVSIANRYTYMLGGSRTDICAILSALWWSLFWTSVATTLCTMYLIGAYPMFMRVFFGWPGIISDAGPFLTVAVGTFSVLTIIALMVGIVWAWCEVEDRLKAHYRKTDEPIPIVSGWQSVRGVVSDAHKAVHDKLCILYTIEK